VVASRNPRDYDADSSQQCGTIQTTSSGCLPLISAIRADGAGVMGYGVIDGRGQLPMMPGGVAGSTTWWDLGNQANAQSRSQNNFRLINVSGTNGFTLYKITLKNSPNFHVVLNSSTNVTAWGVKIIAPYDSPNTDGIDPIYSNNVTITNSWISTGDDNIALNGSSPGSYYVSAVHNWFGDGHGASIGSFTTSGVSNVLFDQITIAGTAANGNQNGIRIKSDVSRGGLVQGITYSNFCMKDVRHPIVIDPFYTAGATGSLVPQYKNITIRNMHATTEGTVKIQGHDANALTTILLDNVLVDGIKASDVTSMWATITTGPGDVNFGNMLQGTGVSIVRNIDFAATPPYNCPAEVFSPVAGELLAGTAPGTVQVQVFATKATSYQTYLANLRTNPNASVSLPAPTGTVTLYDGGQNVGSAVLDASGLSTVSVAGSHVLTASYSGDANYAPITFGKLAIGLDPPRISANGVANGASFKSEIAPGSLFSVLGTNLGETAVAPGYPLGILLGGASVQVIGGTAECDPALGRAGGRRSGDGDLSGADERSGADEGGRGGAGRLLLGGLGCGVCGGAERGERDELSAEHRGVAGETRADRGAVGDGAGRDRGCR
jgi:hypothetical protein